METDKITRLVKNIELMRFCFPYEDPGYGVDKVHHQGVEPEKTSDEEGVEIQVKFHNEDGFRIISGKAALEIYNLTWKEFNDQESRAEQKED